MRKSGLTVLMFHRIENDDNHLGLSISPEIFEELLKYLSGNYRVLSISEAIQNMESGKICPDSVVITFDDGWRDNYSNAFPLLIKYKIPATIFVTFDAVEKGTFGWCAFDQAILNLRKEELDLTSFGLGSFPLHNQQQKESSISLLHKKIKKLNNSLALSVVDHVVSEYGDPGGERIMLSWQEIREMHDSGLISIGAHSVTHPILTRIPLSQANYEINTCKSLLEAKLGAPVDYFAYPNGSPDDFNSEITALVADSGYKAAFSTIPGINRDLSERYCLHRLDVTYGMCRGVGGGFAQGLFAVKVSGIFQGILFRS